MLNGFKLFNYILSSKWQKFISLQIHIEKDWRWDHHHVRSQVQAVFPQVCHSVWRSIIFSSNAWDCLLTRKGGMALSFVSITSGERNWFRWFLCQHDLDIIEMSSEKGGNKCETCSLQLFIFIFDNFVVPCLFSKISSKKACQTLIMFYNFLRKGMRKVGKTSYSNKEQRWLYF